VCMGIFTIAVDESLRIVNIPSGISCEAELATPLS